MGIEVQCKSYFPGYFSMRDLNEDANSSSWPLYYGGDKTLGNGQYCNGYMKRTVADTYSGHDKDALKQKMLEHEAIFKNQVYELHRLYRIQRDMMDEIKKEQHKHRISIDTSSGSSFLVSRMPSEDARRWRVPNFPLANPSYARSCMLDVDIIDSPLSCTKGNSTQAGRFPSQNGFTSKDCEVLESRPSKVRKKLFDLELPADEYIDTEEREQVQNNKISDTSSPVNRDREISHGNNVKYFLGGGGRTDYRGDASTSDSCLRSSIRMTDLNEPIQAEEATAPTSVDFLGRSACQGEIRGVDLSAKPKSEFLGLPNEIGRNFYPASNNRTMTNLSVENTSIGRGWSSHTNGADHNGSNLACIPEGLQQEKFPLPSHPMQVLLNKAHQLPGIFPTDHSREDPCRDRAIRCLEISDRNRDPSNYNCPEPVVASHASNAYPFVNSSDSVNPWSQSVSSWGKPINSLTQKSASAHTHPYLSSLATLTQSSQPSAQGHDICGDKWHDNGNYGPNPSLRRDLLTQNGFYHGSSSRSKELSVIFPSVDFDYQNCTRDNNVASQRPINPGSEKFFNGSNFMELKSAKAMNLNVVLSNVSSNEAVLQQDLTILDEKKKCEDHLAVLPWLRAKPACKSDVSDTRKDSSLYQASSNPLLGRSVTVTDLNQVFSEDVISALSDHDIEAKKERGESLSNKRILGFPIFEYPCASKNELLPILSTSESLCCSRDGELIENKGKNIGIDINLACDPSFPETGDQNAVVAVVVEKSLDTKLTSVRNHIDLNSYMSEDEDLLAPSVANTDSNVKIAVEIDLEAPFVPETEEEIPPEEQQKQNPETLQSPERKVEEPQDEGVKIAAEAIVAMSSSAQYNHKEDTTCDASEASLADSLLWFVEVVSSCVDDLAKKFGKEMRDKGGGGDVEDSFVAMTLQLQETKEEDYMPKPFVPEFQDMEETGATSLSNRPRRSQTRRGRQRRDFQKDILPGLTSLSRHEVTEDLQTFGGLMRATGHPWNTGSTRRNGTRSGAARRRRQPVVKTVPSVVASPVYTPLIQQLNNIEAGLEDRTLTGWGKTPRRPRRQRCPAGNPPPVPLT